MENQSYKIQRTEMKYLVKIEGETRLDKIRNILYREKFWTKPIKATIEGYLIRLTEDKILRRIFEARTRKSKQRNTETHGYNRRDV